MAIPKIPTLAVTRGQLDKVFTIALLFNSVAAAVSVFLFFLSSWWIFLLLGTVGLPFLIGGLLIYKYTRVTVYPVSIFNFCSLGNQCKDMPKTLLLNSTLKFFKKEKGS